MYGDEPPRLNVLKIPRRQHAGKTSVENLDLAYEKEQAKMQAKMKHRSDVLAAYERNIGPSYSPITGTPISTPRTRVGLQSDTVSDIGSAPVEVVEECSTPQALRHKRRDSGCINLFAPPPTFRVNTEYKVRPPFATDDETPKKYVSQRKPAPFATDADDDQPSTKPASTKPPVNFCWRWAFQDEDGNPLPVAEEEEAGAAPVVQTPDFSSMSPRGSPKYVDQTFREVDDEE